MLGLEFWAGFGCGVAALILFAIALALLVALWCSRYLHDFLTPDQPLSTTVLIVEGWVPDRVVKQVAQVIDEGDYQHVLISGLPLHQGAFLTQYRTHAEVTADSLIALGIERDRIVVINCDHTNHYRTHAAALVIRDWLEDQRWPIEQINLCTVGAHARRSWLIYQRVFAPQTAIGVIALADQLYDPAIWWRSSAGFRVVVAETIAYVYTRWLNWRA